MIFLNLFITYPKLFLEHICKFKSIFKLIKNSLFLLTHKQAASYGLGIADVQCVDTRRGHTLLDNDFCFGLKHFEEPTQKELRTNNN